VVAGLLGTVVFGIDLAIVIIAKNEIKNTGFLEFDVQFGNGVWMMLVSVISIWVAVVLLSARACYCCGVR